MGAAGYHLLLLLLLLLLPLRFALPLRQLDSVLHFGLEHLIVVEDSCVARSFARRCDRRIDRDRFALCGSCQCSW